MLSYGTALGYTCYCGIAHMVYISASCFPDGLLIFRHCVVQVNVSAPHVFDVEPPALEYFLARERSELNIYTVRISAAVFLLSLCYGYCPSLHAL